MQHHSTHGSRYLAAIAASSRPPSQIGIMGSVPCSTCIAVHARQVVSLALPIQLTHTVHSTQCNVSGWLLYFKQPFKWAYEQHPLLLPLRPTIKGPIPHMLVTQPQPSCQSSQPTLLLNTCETDGLCIQLNPNAMQRERFDFISQMLSQQASNTYLPALGAKGNHPSQHSSHEPVPLLSHQADNNSSSCCGSWYPQDGELSN